MEQITFDHWPSSDNFTVIKNDPDALLRTVIKQARSIGIPVSGVISPHVVINKRAKTRFGCCKKTVFGYTIELSHLLIEGPRQSCMQVLAHEILHTCYGCRNHGTRWKSYAKRMNDAYGYNISRTDSHYNLGIKDDTPAPRYIIVCLVCGKEYPRLRASNLTKYPGRYRCVCGGRLKHKDK